MIRRAIEYDPNSAVVEVMDQISLEYAERNHAHSQSPEGFEASSASNNLTNASGKASSAPAAEAAEATAVTACERAATC